MKKGLFLATICTAVFSLSSCGPSWNPKKVTTDASKLTNFTSIDIENYVDAVITVQPGADYMVKFEGDEDILKDIDARVEDSVLIIQQKDEMFVNLGQYKKVKMRITVPSLTGLSFGGAGKIVTIGNITGNNFDLDVSGAGDVEIAEVNVDKLSVESSGVAGIDIKKGVVREATYDFSGAGSMEAYGLQSTDAAAEISGVGGIEINVSGTLEASLSGVGSITYKGNPHVNSEISGVGSIKEAN
jgi:hypothetical protein